MVKRIRNFLLIALLLLILAFLLWCLIMPKEVYFTENPDEYNTGNYTFFSDIFLPELPQTASVVSFRLYQYWYEDVEYFLELEFNTEEDMRNYLEDLIESYLDEMPSHDQSLERWIAEEENPYDKSFTDMICTLYWVAGKDATYTGYEISPDENLKYDSNSGIISYSYESLTVIQSYLHGLFYTSEHGEDYVPKYFVRFNVPIDENHKRIYIIRENEE